MRIWLLFFGLVLLGGCFTTEPAAPSLSVAEITQLIPKHVNDRAGWARDVADAIAAADRTPTVERSCAVISVIEQESNFKTDPAVANLPRIVRDGLEKKLSGLGILSGLALKALLSGSAPGQRESFNDRIGKLRSERDLDLFFRDMARAYRGKLPGTFAVATALNALFDTGDLEDLNPVTTAGSMQVKVSFARQLDIYRDLDDAAVRDALYTRSGGVRAGTARLLGYEAAYDDVIYRFADYNAGLYASRNAAFQQRLTDLTGLKLALDGDILAYDGDKPADRESQTLTAMLLIARSHNMWEWLVRRHANSEKTADFENTYIWNQVSDAWTQKFRKEPVYARMPNVALMSPKLSAKRSTAWFAESVKKRYQACRSRLAK